MFSIILIILILAMLGSLAIALKSFLKQSNEQKTYRWLLIRATLAISIVIVIAIGFITGELTIGAPWSGRY